MVLVARLAALSAFVLLTLMTGPGSAQDTRQNEAGKFDFYVLSLSWSPSFCDAASQRSPERSSPQCGERPYSFVVHGFWPQYERGFPEYCQREGPRLDRGIVSSMLDIMPAPQLIFRQWDKHGTCSGLPPRAYFDTVRKARAQIKIPSDYLEPKETLSVTPDEVEEAFVKANPGMTRGAIAVTCDSTRLREVRVCVNRDLSFRDCPEIDRRACRRAKLVMPPVRGG